MGQDFPWCHNLKNTVVPLPKGIVVVPAGPGQLGQVARLAAEEQGVLEVGGSLVKVSDGLGQEAEDPIDSKARTRIDLGSHSSGDLHLILNRLHGLYVKSCQVAAGEVPCVHRVHSVWTR